ncbi:MAG: N-acetylmuramoyl-L-alanine amidase [Lewinellaceae bacterium]|nr:N-acetylmuramoyl-L-alanine amidase [Phaeodactylibacter sp.]MCB9349116.1 N-acetylmuramoyl-L-alanine amidase [Lewinellaceae bacterium]
MQRIQFFLTLSAILAVTLPAIAEPNYHITEAMPGDGIYSMLRRYGLDQYSCNFDQFYRLNSLKKNGHLIVGRKYQLPILIYTFNGKTIRSSIGINDWNTALRIQKYNELMLEKNMRAESFKKDRVLWVPYHELNCPNPDLEIPSPVENSPEEERPTSGTAVGNRKFPIFGPKYAYTPLLSNKLKGKVFYIVSGHGGPDPGAMGRRGDYTLCEDEYAYDVALRLCRNLISHGATAYMITRDDNDGIREGKFLECDYDEVLWGGVKMVRQQKPRLFQRSDIINQLYEQNRLAGVTEQTSIIIHVDSRSKGERTDVFFYHHSSSPASRSIAFDLLRSLKHKYKQYQKTREYRGTVTARDLHMLRETKVNSVYIELANIRNNFDQQRIIVENNRQLLADWLLEGVLK